MMYRAIENFTYSPDGYSIIDVKSGDSGIIRDTAQFERFKKAGLIVPVSDEIENKAVFVPSKRAKK